MWTILPESDLPGDGNQLIPFCSPYHIAIYVLRKYDSSTKSNFKKELFIFKLLK